MTTLLSWISVDSRGPSAIYIVSDSRITWGNADRRWDSGRKVFAPRSADIFGYCGEVLFPSLVLGQVSDLIDRQLLWPVGSDARERHDILFAFMKSSFERRHNALNDDFVILHCSRDGENLDSIFRNWRITYHVKDGSWEDEEIISNGKKSRVVVALGSGSNALSKEIDKWNDTPQAETSRAIFSAFCDALQNGVDPLSGGMPQLVSLDRRSSGKVLGFVTDSVRYVYGMPIKPLPKLAEIEWVDRFFQRLSPDTLELLSGAQRQVWVEKRKPGGLSAFFRRTLK